MDLRGTYVRGAVADFVREHRPALAQRLECSLGDVEVEGKDQTGFYSRVPWVRFADRRRSENPREGWYGVYLFAEDGSEAFISLIQGTQIWDGVGLRSRPEAEIRGESDRVRARLSTEIAARDRLVTNILIGSGDKARAYEALRLVYEAEARGQTEVGMAPEVGEAVRIVQALAGRRAGRQRLRLNARERKAIELRAMALATDHYVARGGIVRDVSATRSYDLEVTVGGAVLTVEVKGSAGDGTEVLLTEGEVRHHRLAYPNNALVVVSSIRLLGPSADPIAIGGQVRVLEPWVVLDEALTPIAHRYAVPSGQSPAATLAAAGSGAEGSP
jgi:hypothetical protein